MGEQAASFHSSPLSASISLACAFVLGPCLLAHLPELGSFSILLTLIIVQGSWMLAP